MKLLFNIFLVGLCFVIGIFFLTKRKNNDSQYGTIILFNGPSSVGKSSIQKKIQELFQKPYLRMGLDDLAFLPERYISTKGSIPPADSGIWLETTQQDGYPVTTIHYGEVAQKMIKGINRTFAAFAVAGNNIVVDYILYDHLWLTDLKHVLKNFKVYFIGIHAPLAVIEEREKKRGNRLLGHARSHYGSVHKNVVYDFEIDTSKLTPEQAAILIQEFIEQNPSPQAFKKN